MSICLSHAARVRTANSIQAICPFNFCVPSSVTDIGCNGEACGHVEKYDFFWRCNRLHMLNSFTVEDESTSGFSDVSGYALNNC